MCLDSFVKNLRFVLRRLLYFWVCFFFSFVLKGGGVKKHNLPIRNSI